MTTASKPVHAKHAPPSNKKAKAFDPLAAAADIKFREHKAETLKKQRVESARRNFTNSLAQARANGFNIVDFTLVQLLSVMFFPKYILKVDEDCLTVCEKNGKVKYTAGKLIYSSSGFVTGCGLRVVDGKGRAWQLVAFGGVPQEHQWHAEVRDWHLLSPTNCPEYPRQLI